MCADGCRCGLSDDLRAAIAAGWRGLTLAAAPPGRVLTAVCAVPADRVEALAGAGLAVGLPPRRPCGHPAHSRVTLALAGDPSVALTLDLGFAEARTVAGRLGRDGRLRLLWARAEDGRAARADLVVLGPEIRDRLGGDAAHHGEWRVADPRPAGFSRLRWWRESMRAPRPRLARGDLPQAPVVVVAPARVPRAEAAAAVGPPDLELAFPEGPPLPLAPGAIAIRLAGDEQRRLGAALARQERVAVLLVDAGGAWLAQVELALGPAVRAVIAAAARTR